MNNIYIAAEHCGITLKKYLLEQLFDLKIKDVYPVEDSSDDYPDVARILALAMKNYENAMGIVICGSGQGICMAMNRFAHIRASQPRTALEATLTREHNDSNVACFGASVMDKEDIASVIRVFVSTPASTEQRHVRRVNKMSEPSYSKV